MAASIVESDLRDKLAIESLGQKHGLELYVETVEAALAYLSQSSMSRQGLAEFENGWAEDRPERLTAAYIDDNPHPIGSKHLLDAAPEGGVYHQAHAAHHPSFRAFLEARGYYDIFLISQTGDIVYSVYKERDYATNLVAGAYKDTGLADAFRAARDSQRRAFVDFAPYAPSAGAPAAFVATPIRAADGGFKGVIALQIPAERIAEAVSLGTDDTTFVAGVDGLLRTDLEETAESEILAATVTGDWVAEAARADQPVIAETEGVLGGAATVSAVRTRVFDEPWIAVAQLPSEQAHAPLSRLTWTLALVLLPTIALIGVVAFLLARSMGRTLSAMAQDMDRIAQGDLERDIAGVERADEVGQMARALLVFKENALRVHAMADEKEKSDAAAEQARRRMMSELQSSFGAVVDAAVAGDFSGRVPATFADDELNALAAGVNRMLESVADGVGATGSVMARLADGDLRERMDGEYQGAFAKLQRDVNGTLERLADLIGDIAQTTASVGHSSEEIKVGSADLAARAEQQASSLEQTAATMEQMSASVKSNADSSSNAQTLAAEASARAAAGGAIVGDAVSAMTEIETSAAKIADIISVIDGIAFQTNLLALNAAVEAARAGDAGKGFAVVASEVRALAQRSSDASRDIRHLIETSAGQVSEGVRLVTQTGASLTDIARAIEQLEEAIRSIAQASVEQATGVEEISSAVSHMDQMTQENSSLSEKSASSARMLSGDAAKLLDLVAFFEVGRGGSEARADASWRTAEVAAAPAPAPTAPPRREPDFAPAGASWAEF